MFKVLLSVLFSLLCVSLYSKTVIHAGNLFNANNGSIEPEMTIFIEDDKITDVIEGYVNPEIDDTYLDLTGYFVLPGLIDMHVHLTNLSSNKAYLESYA